jgi:hypothetical protein
MTGPASGHDSARDVCPQQACTSGLILSLPHAGDWKTGAYDVEVETEWGTLSCHKTLEAPKPSPTPPVCAQQAELTLECAPPMGPSLGPIFVEAPSSTVRVRVAREGTVLASETVTPSWTRKRWDGFECAAACAHAQASVSVK